MPDAELPAASGTRCRAASISQRPARTRAPEFTARATHVRAGSFLATERSGVRSCRRAGSERCAPRIATATVAAPPREASWLAWKTWSRAEPSSPGRRSYISRVSRATATPLCDRKPGGISSRVDAVRGADTIATVTHDASRERSSRTPSRRAAARRCLRVYDRIDADLTRTHAHPGRSCAVGILRRPGLGRAVRRRGALRPRGSLRSSHGALPVAFLGKWLQATSASSPHCPIPPSPFMSERNIPSTRS